MEKKYYWKSDSDRKVATQLLQDEKIITGSTDTIPGLFALPTAVTFQKLNAIKGRQNKPYLLLAGSIDEVKKLTDFFTKKEAPLAPYVDSLMKQYWPGPLTLILPAQKSLPSFLTGNTPHVAVRVPNHPYILKLLETIPLLFSTSANKAGQTVPESIDMLDPKIKQHVALIIEDEKESGATQPSTLVDCTGETLKVIREGAISTRDIIT